MILKCPTPTMCLPTYAKQLWPQTDTSPRIKEQSVNTQELNSEGKRKIPRGVDNATEDKTHPTASTRDAFDARFVHEQP